MVVTALLFHIAEPTENLADVPEDQIVETIETSDGPVASTVEHVHEIAKDVHKLALFSVYLCLSLSLSHTCSSIIWFLIIPFQGFHCVLCLRAEDLTRPGVASLTPIVLLLNPKQGFKITTQCSTTQTTQCSRTYTCRPNGKQSTGHVSA